MAQIQFPGTLSADFLVDQVTDPGGAPAGLDRQEAEPEPAAEVAHVAPMNRRPPSAAAARPDDRKVHAIREREPIDALEHQRKPEAQLQLHDHRRLVAPDGDDVAAAHLGLDVVSLTLQKGFDRRVQVGLGG